MLNAKWMSSTWNVENVKHHHTPYMASEHLVKIEALMKEHYKYFHLLHIGRLYILPYF